MYVKGKTLWELCMMWQFLNCKAVPELVSGDYAFVVDLVFPSRLCHRFVWLCQEIYTVFSGSWSANLFHWPNQSLLAKDSRLKLNGLAKRRWYRTPVDQWIHIKITTKCFCLSSYSATWISLECPKIESSAWMYVHVCLNPERARLVSHMCVLLLWSFQSWTHSGLHVLPACLAPSLQVCVPCTGTGTWLEILNAAVAVLSVKVHGPLYFQVSLCHCYSEQS